MRMKEKAAIVTGAASGIGREIARAFAREGAKVCIADLVLEQSKQVANEIERAGGKAVAMAMDVTNEAQVESGVASTIERFGGLDVLVSNAGFQHISSIVDLTLDAWRRLLAVHLDGAFLTTRACLRHMFKARKGGSIIYMGSGMSKDSAPFKGPYVTAKHGLIGLCKVVAREGAAAGVRSNVICPGFVRTPLVEKQIPELARQQGISEQEVIKNVMLKDTVDGEFTTTMDVAEVAVFFASFPSNALTGQSVVVSHGWAMQ